MPIFPELKRLFQDAFDVAKDGAVHCITRYRDNGVNLRTQMNKIIARTGVEPWSKTFQNLRSTGETELFKLTGGNVKAVCQWIGNMASSTSLASSRSSRGHIHETQPQTSSKLLANFRTM